MQTRLFDMHDASSLLGYIQPDSAFLISHFVFLLSLTSTPNIFIMRIICFLDFSHLQIKVDGLRHFHAFQVLL